MMKVFEISLLVFLVVSAIGVNFTKKLVHSVIFFSGFSLIMSVIWLLLLAPDVGITEVAVGAGIDSVLFYLVLRNINKLEEQDDEQ